VINWAAYNASLRQRGSLTLWFSEEAIAGWRAAPRTTRGGQAWYSPLAILTGRWCMDTPAERSVPRCSAYLIRTDTGMPRLVIRFSTLQPIFASVR
jgi:hypothetical protein